MPGVDLDWDGIPVLPCRYAPESCAAQTPIVTVRMVELHRAHPRRLAGTAVYFLHLKDVPAPADTRCARVLRLHLSTNHREP